MNFDFIKYRIAILGFLSVLVFSVTSSTAKAAETGLFTYDEYLYNSENKCADVQMKRINMDFEERTVLCDVFAYGSYLYVPLRSAVEIMGKSAEYDISEKSVKITENHPNSYANGVLFDRGEVKAEFNTIPIYFDSEVFDYADITEDHSVFPKSFNCEGHIYVPLAKLIENTEYYRYYGEDGNIFIKKESGRLKLADKSIHEKYVLEGVKPLYIPPYADNELLEEAEHIAWSRCSEPEEVTECKTSTFSYDGKDYIKVEVHITERPNYRAPDEKYNWIKVFSFEIE